MSEQNNQPDLLDRPLIPARSKATLSREIGEAVVTETIFGRAKVRIIRKGDKTQRVLWTVTFIAAGIAAFIAWQVWDASNQTAVPEAQAPVEAAGAESIAASQPVAPPAVAQSAVPPQTIAVVPVAVAHSAPGTVGAASAAVPARPLIAPRPLPVSAQSAPLASTTLAASAVAAPPVRVLPRPMPPRPAASAPVAATAIRPQAASSPAVVVPLSSPLGGEATPAATRPATEPIKQ